MIARTKLETVFSLHPPLQPLCPINVNDVFRSGRRSMQRLIICSALERQLYAFSVGFDKFPAYAIQSVALADIVADALREAGNE